MKKYKVSEDKNARGVKQVSESTPESNIMFIGPPAAGKTTAMLLLLHTVVDYKEELGIRNLTPVVRTGGVNIFADASRLVRQGIPPAPTQVEAKDIKLELNIVFRGFPLGKRVSLIFADMAGRITETLLKVFPEIAAKTPNEVRDTLKTYGLSEEDVQYIVNKVFTSKGFILVVNYTKIGTEEDPDVKFSSFMNNFITYRKARMKGEKLKGVAVLVTHWDKAIVDAYRDRESILKDALPITSSFIKNDKLIERSAVFLSGIYDEYETPTGEKRFHVTIDHEGRRRIRYTVNEYKELVMWIRDTF